MKNMIRVAASVMLVLLMAACSDDPMDACMKRSLGAKAENSSRGEYIKAREKARADCERQLR